MRKETDCQTCPSAHEQAHPRTAKRGSSLTFHDDNVCQGTVHTEVFLDVGLSRLRRQASHEDFAAVTQSQDSFIKPPRGASP